MTDDPKPDPAKRRFRLPSVRVLVVATLLLALATVSVTVMVPYRRQMKLIERIEGIGGQGHIDTVPVGPEWLRKLLGEERMRGFEVITVVIINGPVASDETLEQMEALTDLTKLYLINAEVTDDGLRHLAGMQKLRLLQIQSPQVTQSAIEELRKRLPMCLIAYSPTPDWNTTTHDQPPAN